MPQKLSERPEELIRQFLVDNVRPGEIEGYDPRQTDTQATDYIPFTTDYSRWGETYPMVWFGEEGDPNTPGGGQTGYTGIQGDGSGPNQDNVYSITVSVQTLESDNGAGYLNSTDYDTLAFEIYNELHDRIQTNVTTAISELEYVSMTPPTTVREAGEDSDTTTFYQQSGTVGALFRNEP